MMDIQTPAPLRNEVESRPLLYVWLVSLVAAMGGFLFGYDYVVIGGAKPFYEKYFQIDETWLSSAETARLSGWAMSCALLGCLAGALLAGGLSDKFGRKKLLILAGFLFAVSSALTGWAPSFILFVVWRMLGGVAIGITSNVAPVYIAEVAPAHLRGRFVSIYQLTIFIGFAVGQTANWLIARQVPDAATADFIRQSWNGQVGWRWMFTAVSAPALVFFFAGMFLPESPRWLVKNGMRQRALRVLQSLCGESRAAAQLDDIQQTISSEEVQRVRFADLLEPKMFKILLIGVFLAVLQQWSGMNIFFNYAEDVYKAAGYGLNAILGNIVITGAVCLAVNCVAIGTVDHFGRRILMLIGCAGIGLCHASLGACYLLQITGPLLLIITLTAIGLYSMSLAPIAWVLISEIFPNRIRGAAVSVAASSLWIACFALNYTFPFLKEHLGKGNIGMARTIWLYGAICFLGFVIVYARVPETKGKTLEQIERELVD